MPKGVALTDEHRAKISAALTRPVPSEKRCRSCKQVKPADAFRRRATNERWLRSDCMGCESRRTSNWAKRNPDRVRAANDRSGIRRYGIEPETYAAMLERQSGLCAICRQPPKRRRLAIDHDHDTGAVRGLLCDHCNAGLGMFVDNPEVLDAAAAYLRAPA